MKYTYVAGAPSQFLPRIEITKFPKFMELMMPEFAADIKHMIEHGFVELGFSSDSEDNCKIAIKFYEMQGKPYSKFAEEWVTGVADPFSGIARYAGALKDGLLKFGKQNHTMDISLVLLDRAGDFAFNAFYLKDLIISCPVPLREDSINSEDKFPMVHVTIEMSGALDQSLMTKALVEGAEYKL